MIEKPSILITSIGRTGTEFFARLFTEIIPEGTALHEPDIIKARSLDNRLVQFLQQVRRAGIWRMVILKALGIWSLVKLSDGRFTGNLSEDQAMRRLCNQRKDFVTRQPGSIYVETNLGFYGLLDITPRVFERHRAIYLVRDGRDWVRSHMNWAEVYGNQGLRKWVSHQWPAASAFPQDPYAERWAAFSQFERLCWAWSRLNKYALVTLTSNQDARLFYFEKLFSGDQRYAYLDELMTFATNLPGIHHPSLAKTDGWLDRKIHASPSGFPGWEDWTTAQKRGFEAICGPLMAELGYWG